MRMFLLRLGALQKTRWKTHPNLNNETERLVRPEQQTTIPRVLATLLLVGQAQIVKHH